MVAENGSSGTSSVINPTEEGGNTYSLTAKQLTGIGSDKKLYITVTVKENPTVTFTGALVQKDGTSGWVNEITVEHGDDLTFHLQTAGTVTPDKDSADNYGELQGAGTTWTLTNVTGDISVTIG